MNFSFSLGSDRKKLLAPAKKRIRINFTADFGRAAAEIEQIVKLKINFTINFELHAAEMEQIVKLIGN